MPVTYILDGSCFMLYSGHLIIRLRDYFQKWDIICIDGLFDIHIHWWEHFIYKSRGRVLCTACHTSDHVRLICGYLWWRANSCTCTVLTIVSISNSIANTPRNFAINQPGPNQVFCRGYHALWREKDDPIEFNNLCIQQR